MNDKKLEQEILRRMIAAAQARVERWTQEYERVMDNWPIAPPAPAVHPLSGVARKAHVSVEWPLMLPEAKIIPFPVERTRRPKGEHWFEWPK